MRIDFSGNKLFTYVCIAALIGVLLFVRTCKCSGSNNATINHNEEALNDSMQVLVDSFQEQTRAAQLQLDSVNGLRRQANRSADSLKLIVNNDKLILSKQESKLLALANKIHSGTDTTKSTDCDSLSDLVNKFFWNNAIAKDHTDSLLAAKDWQLEICDSTNVLLLELAEKYHSYFRTSTELFGAAYMAYNHVKPRNRVSVLVTGQYYNGKDLLAVGGGLQLTTKKNFGFQGLVLIDPQGNKIYQGSMIFPISLRKNKN